MRAIVTLACVAVLAGPALADPIDDFVLAEMSSRKIPGLTFTVIRDGAIVETRSYGFANLETRTPAHAGTVWAIGSITKSFTAIALMTLVVEGKVDLDAPLSGYIDPPHADWGRVTVRQLLGNASGVPESIDNPCSHTPPSTRAPTRQDVLLEAACLPLGFEPGERFEYCNTNFHLLAEIIEAVTGATFEEVVRTRILDPLDLRDTSFLDHERVVVHRADGYRWTEEGYVNEVEMELVYESAPGGLMSTAPDLARFVLALGHERLLPAARWQEMWTPFPVRTGRTPYGLGFGLTPFEGRARIGHNGAGVGFTSTFSWFPGQRTGIVVLGNGYQEPFGRNVQDLAHRIAERYWED